MKKQIEDKPKILFKNRIVPIKGDITIASGQQVIVSLLKMITSKQPIFLPIHSDGGDFKTAKKIKQAIDNIQERGIQVIGIAIQSVRSSACYILESCKERVIEADAVLIPRILHTHCEYGFELTPQTTLAEIHESLDELVKIEREKMRNDQEASMIHIQKEWDLL